MIRPGGLALWVPLLLSSACSLSLPWRVPEVPPRNVRLSVEMHRGFANAPIAPPAEPERVEILIDVTPSMATATLVGPGRFVAAQRVASRLVRNLPPESFIGLHALGVAEAAECTPVLRTDHRGPGEARDELLRSLEELRPAGEASLADAIEGLRAILGATETLAGSRVVILSDLGHQCGGDICGQVRRMVARGARLEFVVFGDAPIPDCLDAFEVPGAWRMPADSRRAEFRVEPLEAGIPAVIEGIVGGEPIAVSPGAVRIVVDLDPPLEFGPVDLVPGSTARLRILDFPALDPPVREATFESDAGEVERAMGSDADARP